MAMNLDLGLERYTERRGARREAVADERVMVRLGSVAVAARLVDISTGGAKVVLRGAQSAGLMAGDKLKLEMDVPATMRDGCVVWVRGDEVGMRFVG